MTLELRKLLAALLFAGLPAAALAQSASSYPSRPVRLIVPLAPGGAVDALARMIGAYMESRFKQPFLVENRPGALTQIGTEAVVKAAPDGQTLLVTSTPVASEQVLTKAWPFRVERDLTMISMFAGGGNAMITASSVPVSNLREFAAYAKANPGKLNLANGGGTAVGTLLLLNRLGIPPLFEVMYKGGPASVQSVVTGDTHLFGAAVQDVVELAKAGKVRILAYTERERHPLLPSVPTVRESGVGLNDWDTNFWFALLGPAGLPPDITDKLNAAMLDMLKTPEATGRLAGFGLRPYLSDAADSRGRIRAYIRDLDGAVAAGIVAPK